MTEIDGTEEFNSTQGFTAQKINKLVVWTGIALPVGAANKVPQYGKFLLLDSLSAPTTAVWYIQTSATLSSPNFVALPDDTGLPYYPLSTTIGDYTQPSSRTNSISGITFDNGQGTAGTGTSVTYSNFAVGSGSNRILVVFVQAQTIADVTGITFGGVSLTLLDTYQPNTGNWSAASGFRIYYLLSPANSTANIVVSSSSSQAMSLAAASYSGVAQSSTFGTANKVRKGATSPIDFSVTPTQSESAIVMCVSGNCSTVPTISYTSTQTKRGSGTTGGQIVAIGEAVYAIAAAQTPQATWSGGTSVDIAGMAVEMRRAYVAGVNSSVYVTMASDLNMVSVAVYGDSNMTETEIKIRTNTNAEGTTFTDSNLRRTILTSKILAGQWNYILLPAKLGKHLQIYGSSGSSLVLALPDIRVRTVTDAVFGLGHKHKTISATDTSIALSG